MAELKKASDPSKGQPNLEFLLYLQENWDEDDIANFKVNGVKIKRFPVVADAGTAALEITGVPVGAIITNVHVIATVANTAGTLQLKTNADTPAVITDAMICAVDKVVVNASTIDDAYLTVTADGLQVLAGGTDETATRGIVVIEYI